MKRYLLIFLGLTATCLGVLGIFLPILPTTPFLLLASFLFYHSSDYLRNWLINNRVLGRYIKNYIVYKAIPLRSKIMAISFLWATILLSAFVFIDKLWLQILLIFIAVGVTIHILHFKTLRSEIDNDTTQQTDNKQIADE
jgi:uncharacterized membrane protein YbaN (DUF454 family)